MKTTHRAYPPSLDCPYPPLLAARAHAPTFTPTPIQHRTTQHWAGPGEGRGAT